MDEERHTIQDLVPPARSRPLRTQSQKTVPESEDRLPPKPQRARGGGRWALTAVVVVIVLAIAGAFGVVSTVFHHATISVSIKKFDTTVASSTFEASPTGTTLSFATLSTTLDASKTVASTGTRHIETKAAGTITIHNSGKAVQRLITNTRFANEAGLIYRIAKAVTIPANGTTEAVVTADQTGANYNLATGNLSVPGLTGTPEAALVSASVSKPISGGFAGDEAIVTPGIHDEAVNALKSDLDRKVRDALTAKVPSQGVVLPDSVTIVYTEGATTPADQGATITVSAVATAPVFSIQQIAQLIATEAGTAYSAPLTIKDLSKLLISISPSKTKGNLTLALSGSATLSGVFDPNALGKELAGKDRKAAGAVLANYPAVTDMHINVYPFWQSTLPKDPAKITVQVDQ